MKQGDKIELECGAVVEIDELNRLRDTSIALALVKITGAQGTTLVNGVLNVRFLNKSIPGIIAALTKIRKELNKKPNKKLKKG